MTDNETVKILKFNMEMLRFNPISGECIPMNKDCEELANALESAIEIIENANKGCGDCKYHQCTHPHKDSCNHCELWWGKEKK